MTYRILCVDDEALLREAMSLFLESMGLSAHCVDSPAACLDEFRARGAEYDLVLMNYDMPQKNGVELLREIRAIDPDARVALTSGYPRTKVLESLEASEAVPFLPKPFDRAKLRRFLLDQLPGVEPAVVAVVRSTELGQQIAEALAADFRLKTCDRAAEALREARHTLASVVLLELTRASTDEGLLEHLRQEGIPLVFLDPEFLAAGELRELGEILAGSVDESDLPGSILRALHGAD